jgi:hypothetical protein
MHDMHSNVPLLVLASARELDAHRAYISPPLKSYGVRARNAQRTLKRWMLVVHISPP